MVFVNGRTGAESYDPRDANNWICDGDPVAVFNPVTGEYIMEWE